MKSNTLTKNNHDKITDFDKQKDLNKENKGNSFNNTNKNTCAFFDKNLQNNKKKKATAFSFVQKGSIINKVSNDIKEEVAKKYGLDPTKWDGNVEEMVKNLSQKKYYQ